VPKTQRWLIATTYSRWDENSNGFVDIFGVRIPDKLLWMLPSVTVNGNLRWRPPNRNYQVQPTHRSWGIYPPTFWDRWVTRTKYHKYSYPMHWIFLDIVNLKIKSGFSYSSTKATGSFWTSFQHLLKSTTELNTALTYVNVNINVIRYLRAMCHIWIWCMDGIPQWSSSQVLAKYYWHDDACTLYIVFICFYMFMCVLVNKYLEVKTWLFDKRPCNFSPCSINARSRAAMF